jgi:hypothetical protein
MVLIMIETAFQPPYIGNSEKILQLRKSMKNSPHTVSELDLSPVPILNDYSEIINFSPISHDEYDWDSFPMFDMNLGPATIPDRSHLIDIMTRRARTEKPKPVFAKHSIMPSVCNSDVKSIDRKTKIDKVPYHFELPTHPCCESRSDGKKLVKKLKALSRDEEFYYGGFPGSEYSIIFSDEDESDYELVDAPVDTEDEESDFSDEPNETRNILDSSKNNFFSDDSDEEFLEELRRDMKKGAKIIENLSESIENFA